MSYTQQVVNYLEAIATSRIIHSSNVRYHCVLGRGVVFEEGNDRNDARRWDIDCELVFPDGELLDVFWETGEEILPVGVQGGGFFLVFVGGVYDRGVKLPSSLIEVWDQC